MTGRPVISPSRLEKTDFPAPGEPMTRTRFMRGVTPKSSLWFQLRTSAMFVVVHHNKRSSSDRSDMPTRNAPTELGILSVPCGYKHHAPTEPVVGDLSAIDYYLTARFRVNA